jgi:hypothetical protein
MNVSPAINQTNSFSPALAASSLCEFDSPSDIFSEVPQRLKDRKNWVTWKIELREQKGVKKPTKPPYNPATGKYASSSDPSTWTSFETAVSVMDHYAGIGFMLGGTRLAGVDFDGCVKDGQVEPYVLEILKWLGDPYCELSPSGTGLHVFIECDPLPNGSKIKFSDLSREKYGAEFYHGSATNRYLTVTGKRFSGDGIPKVEKIRFPYILISQILDEKFKALWMGDLSMHGNDHSAADLALMGMLGRLLDGHQEAMRLIFGRSKLGQRDKWQNRKDYQDRTITKALQPNQTQTQVQTQSVHKVNLAETDSHAETEEPEITEEPLPEFPQITGSISEFADALCPDIPREFKIMAAVTRIGLMLTGRVSLANETHLQPRFYTCAIADKGRGKSASNNEVGRRLNPLGDYHNTPSVDSGPALVDVFSEQDAIIDRETSFAKVLLNPDEMIDLFEKAKLSREGRNSIFTELLRLFEANETGNRARKAGQPIELSNAALALIGSATPEGYDQMWVGSRGASGGLQSRFTLVTTTAPPIPTRPRPSDEEKIKAALERIKSQIRCSNVLLSMTDEASGMLHDWWNKTTREKNSEVRIPDIVKRFLMVLAVTNDRDAIDRDLMSVGIQFGEYQIAVRERFMPVDSFSWTQAFENKIITIHEKHGPMTRDKCRKLVHPDRSPGGFGEFLKAYGNLVHAGVLSPRGKTQRASKFGLN